MRLSIVSNDEQEVRGGWRRASKGSSEQRGVEWGGNEEAVINPRLVDRLSLEWLATSVRQGPGFRHTHPRIPYPR